MVSSPLQPDAKMPMLICSAPCTSTSLLLHDVLTRHTSSKYSKKHHTCGQLYTEQTNKILCKNIHRLLRNCGFRVGAFYFVAPCICRLRCARGIVLPWNPHTVHFHKFWRMSCYRWRNHVLLNFVSTGSQVTEFCHSEFVIDLHQCYTDFY